ncbi:hypothetical protein KVH02_34525 [Streptomyces olivaceus]|uniref:DUF2470 domain-containing protein n=1 Tax=Streptomyces olivaceus TaxID=47716 RepID=A0ABS7WE37_STROV|nr:hypothetical protein [Streptomyces olivaceus]MBZ6093383.1 hypothetical protein [Streptomyces olivaceus]MBZ6100747.1 hypothetical protein [Streptomyces olivaceus]MBZ6121845.1 hypothetical protein [Streptomyces olivaceus]MBZ6156216.1 hypothetical protein [Streptomyces olivaceus]MBZ6303111.1 hypothetical protein [Streptomyces olivaceus]
MITDVRPVHLADVERRARAAVADRLQHAVADTSLTVTRDPEHDDAVLLYVDSGGSALVCNQALHLGAGYTCELLPSPGGPGRLMRIRSGDAVDSELFRRALALFRSFAQTSYEPGLSAGVMPVLRELLPPEPSYLTRLERFVRQNEERLERLYDRFGTGSEHATTGRYALVRQPEGLIVIEQLDIARYDVFAAFDGEIEDRYLTDIARAWGVRV